MNTFLAELYKTSQSIGLDKTASADAEKLAQAAILEEMLKNEGLKAESLTGAELVKVAAEIFGKDSPLVKSAGEMPPQFAANAGDEKKKCDEEKKKEEEEKKEKMAEADFLGRQMAHAYVAELHNIEKQAQAKAEAEKVAAASSTSISTILGKVKQASAPQANQVETLARQRAEQMIKEAQNQDAQLEEQVQKRTLEMLKEAGYSVS